jgi:DNA-directed RNA polymerase subunit H
MSFNLLNHELVPEHHVLDDKEEKEALAKAGVTKDMLPRILRDDPVVRFLEEHQGPIQPGRVVRIVRKSFTAGISTVYRVVAGRRD